jgi:hypothetical protein
MMEELLIPVNIVFVGLGLMVCFKLYNDKVKSIIISHDQIQIDFKLLKTRVDNLLNITDQTVQTTEPLLSV